MIKTYGQLFTTVKDWVIKNNKAFYDYSYNELSNDYIKSLIVPDDKLEVRSVFIENQDTVLAVFRAEIEIDYRSAVSRKNNKFVYYKLMEVNCDDNGNILNYDEIGYEW